jgi:hypothetical protein
MESSKGRSINAKDHKPEGSSHERRISPTAPIKIAETLRSAARPLWRWTQRRICDRQDARLRKRLDAEHANKWTVYHQHSGDDLLNALCDKYGSDKGGNPSKPHTYAWSPLTYADFYGRLFGHCRHGVRRVFECGIGTINPPRMGADYRPGASLRVWRDYFPNAQVIGADIDRASLFAEDRIKTFWVDQTDPQAIAAMWDEVGMDNFDLMIDDGLHTFKGGSTLFTHSVSRLAAHGIYVIEDVGNYDDVPRYQSFFPGQLAVYYVTLLRPAMLRPQALQLIVVIRRL